MTPQNTTNAVGFLALCHATCVSVFIRKGFGAEALGFNGAVAFIILLVCAGGDKSGGMLLYFFAWLIALLIQRAITIRNECRGHYQHSKYTGWPWLGLKFCKTEATAKRWVEPFLCVVFGIALLQVSESVGTFVLCGAISLKMVDGINSFADYRRIQIMHDAEIEMRRLRQMYRR
jgi:hypothetical protein